MLPKLQTLSGNGIPNTKDAINQGDAYFDLDNKIAYIAIVARQDVF